MAESYRPQDNWNEFQWEHEIRRDERRISCYYRELPACLDLPGEEEMIFSSLLSRPDLVPITDAMGYPLKYLLKTGTMVLFYEQSPAELYECSPRELAKRLYKVTGFSTLTVSNNSYGRFTLKHHQEARPAGDLKAKSGAWSPNETYRPVISLLHTQLNAYVEGYDFELSVTGKITFKH